MICRLAGILTFLCCLLVLDRSVAGSERGSEVVLFHGKGGVDAVFERSDSGWRWTGYRDLSSGREWKIAGPLFSLQTSEGERTNLGEAGFKTLLNKDSGGRSEVQLETELTAPPVAVRLAFSFCGDERTLRIAGSLRVLAEPVVIQRVGLLEIKVEGEHLRLNGPELVSCPIFGDRIFAGIEHPSAWRQIDGDTLYLAQHSYTHAGSEWFALPPAVFGTSSSEDDQVAGSEALRRAFLRYLETVRLKPADMHVHYNDWWTAPVPSSETDVLKIISSLKKGLYEPTGFFFDSYAMDMGWSDPHSVWEIDGSHFPQGFSRVKKVLAEMGSHPGLWVSPSSLYLPALDNDWLGRVGYEIIPREGGKAAACLARGGKYQRAFKEAVLRHAQAADLAHVKFDGYVPSCDVAEHGHPTGPESYLPIAEGLADVFDALRSQSPGVALEPTCFGSYPSPWWLLHVPFIIGPFGDDSPFGRSPCPEWLESMITARDFANLSGRGAFLLPSSALQCFDIVYQCPGDFQNLAAMAIGRGRWFISCYINPKYMDEEKWRFFADLMAWARDNRQFLQEPQPVGGDPSKREAYGYRFTSEGRQLYCLRNPWIEEATMEISGLHSTDSDRLLRMLYPRREILAHVSKGSPLPRVRLGPYETQFVEVVSAPGEVSQESAIPQQQPVVSWRVPDNAAGKTDSPGEMSLAPARSLRGEVTVRGVLSAELCVLCEGLPEVTQAVCSIQVDGRDVPVTASRSAGSFAAAGGSPPEHWVWFLSPIGEGEHSVFIEVKSLPSAGKAEVFLRGTAAAPSVEPFGPGPSLPLFREDRSPWARRLGALVNGR
jgi:hypothetical protein